MDVSSIWRDRYAHPCPWDQNFAPISLPELFDDAVAQFGSRPMIDFFGRRFSYDAIAQQVERFACGLHELRIQRGDRIGLFLPNVPQYVIAYYAALKIGAVVVNFSPLYSVEELAHQVVDSGTRLLVTIDDKRLFPAAKAVLDITALEHLVVGSIPDALPPIKRVLYNLFRRGEKVPLPADHRIIGFQHLARTAGTCPAIKLSPEKDVALLQYSGGTTGVPKGAILTHQNLSANARQVLDIDPHAGDLDRMLGVLPFFHVFANTAVLNRTIHAGGEIVMLPRFDSGEVLAAIKRTRPTSFPGVPTMFQALLDNPATAKTDFSSMRVIISGGAALPSTLKEKFESVTGVIVAEGYGLTELSGVASVNPYGGDNRAGTIGQPLPATRFALVDKTNPQLPPPAGEAGEIIISGPQVMHGYWNHPEADRTAFVNGWLRTGDVGLIDEDGYIKIIDRLKDMISVGGFKVFPTHVEDVLLHHPAVHEAVVVGAPDSYHGEMPVAFVSLNPGIEISVEELIAWANGQLGKHERLREVEIRDSLPKTAVGKLSRKELRAEVIERAASA